jgi:hypothetical protein
MKSRRMRWVVHVAHMGEMVGKPEGVWKNNIEMDLKQIR